MSEKLVKTKRNIENPRIVRFIPESDTRQMIRDENRLGVPINAPWGDFNNVVAEFLNEGDSGIVVIDPNVDLDNAETVNSLMIKHNRLGKIAESQDKYLLTRTDNDEWYLLNPDRFETDKYRYAPSNETVIEKFETFEDGPAWKKHQSEVWERLSHMMPLAEAKFQGSPNHIADLTHPGRGLSREDLEDFWSWTSNRVLDPNIMGDNMVGMPGMVGQGYEGFTITPTAGENAGVRQPIEVKSVATTGMPGIVIPMSDEFGNMAKFQIASDITNINVRLTPRAADGVSIQRSEIYDKNRYMYTLTMDGQPSGLRVVSASHSEQDKIVMADRNGEFHVAMGENIREKLVDRGYDMPEFIATLDVGPNAKYMWPSAGTMIGSNQKTQRTVSPSDAGFIVSREPKNKADDYVVVVTEGALKGHIVAKYLNSEDATGQSVSDFIAKDSGVIVAQVPGVAKAFVESVAPIYDQYKVKGTYIAMDADGRENRSVAKGIAAATEVLSEYSPVKVLSWDPVHKGMDDALIAVGRHEITVDDMDIHFGTPEQLFPIAQAMSPNPYKLNGERAHQQQWQLEYAESKAASDKAIKEAQEATAEAEKGSTEERAKALEDAGKDLEELLPEEDEGLQQ